MKAFLLAAGKGTRLKPYTDKHPKCLIPIHGTPLLQLWIDLLERHAVTDILINTHHHAGQVETYIRSVRQRTQAALHTVFEPELRGSAGTLWDNRQFVAGQSDFIVAYADNLTNVDLAGMAAAHRQTRARGGVLTMALIHAPDPRACGIVTLDNDNRIVKFVEKPAHPESSLANGGIYIVSSGIFAFFDTSAAKGGGLLDIGHDLLPKLEGKMFGHDIAPAYLKDIGTPQAYREALGQWPVD